MLTTKMVHSCPYTKGSKGILKMSPELIGKVAGCVRDSIEWILLLSGERSTDGYEVGIKEFKVPPQVRGVGHATIDKIPLTSDIVGVMHSHHRMGAFFSGTDINDLNPRFPTSIVVAQATNALGFTYQAEGKVVLPCGSVGKVPFGLSVNGIKSYSSSIVKGFTEDDLGDCFRFTTNETTYATERDAVCGLGDIEEKSLAFGLVGGDELLDQIREATEKPIFSERHTYNDQKSPSQNHWWDGFTNSTRRKMICDLCETKTNRLKSSPYGDKEMLCPTCYDQYVES